MAGHRIDAALSLLDRQIVDRDGELAGKVDDLELRWADDGGPPYVAAILNGPGALSPRLGKIGRWVASVRVRLNDPRLTEGRGVRSFGSLSFGVVTKISDDVEVSLSRADMDESLSDRWVSHRIISRIPGANHEAE